MTVKTPDDPTLNLYREGFEVFQKSEACGGEAVCHERREAFERFMQKGFPAGGDEWRYTRLEGVKTIPVGSASPQSMSREALSPYSLDPAWPTAVFIDGVFHEDLSQGLETQPGLKVESFSRALRRLDKGCLSMVQASTLKPRPLTDLNTAFFSDGLCIRIEQGAKISQPLHILSFFSFQQAEGTIHPRHTIEAHENSEAILVQSFVGLGSRQYFSNTLMDVRLSQGARLDHYVLQQGSETGIQTARCEVSLAEKSAYQTTIFASDTASFRHETDAQLKGQSASVRLQGLYLTDGTEQIDQSVLIEHQVPECTSEQIIKGILDGRSRLSVRGKVHVYEDAQKTDAQQSIRTLLLSPDAVANALPQLEIYADDVKCSHGTAIGQLEDDFVFYLKSRGIGEKEARRILTRGFAMEIIDRIVLKPVRAAAEKALNAHFTGV